MDLRLNFDLLYFGGESNIVELQCLTRFLHVNVM